MGFRRIFLEHPASVGETYREHFMVAARCAAELLVAALAAAAHAVVPAVCVHTASRRVGALDRRLSNRAVVAAAPLSTGRTT